MSMEVETAPERVGVVPIGTQETRAKWMGDALIVVEML